MRDTSDPGPSDHKARCRHELNNFQLLSPSRAAEDPKCFVGIDIDSFKIISLIQNKRKEGVITAIRH